MKRQAPKSNAVKWVLLVLLFVLLLGAGGYLFMEWRDWKQQFDTPPERVARLDEEVATLEERVDRLEAASIWSSIVKIAMWCAIGGSVSFISWAWLRHRTREGRKRLSIKEFKKLGGEVVKEEFGIEPYGSTVSRPQRRSGALRVLLGVFRIHQSVPGRAVLPSGLVHIVCLDDDIENRMVFPPGKSTAQVLSWVAALERDGLSPQKADRELDFGDVVEQREIAGRAQNVIEELGLSGGA